MKNKWLWSLTGALLLSAGVSKFVVADETVPALSLDQRLAILERQYEIDQEDAAKWKAEGSGVTSGKDGSAIKSNNGKFSLKFWGYAQSDHREYLSDRGAFTDTFLLRRVRPGIDGTLNGSVDFRILADFANGGGTTAGPTSGLLQDAYVEIKTFPAFKVRTGKFKAPLSLERLQSGPANTFVELALPTALASNRETGIQVSGDFKGGAVSYQAGVFNGVTDGTSGETDVTDSKDVIGRVFVQPFKTTAGAFQGLGLGVAGSYGKQKGVGGAAATAQLPSFRSNGQQTVFSYNTAAFADGKRTRVSPQVYWYNNNLGLLGEYIVSTQDIRQSSTTASTVPLSNRAWSVAGSFVLTGESASYRGVKPKKVFDPKNKGWGALELTGRYSQLSIDKAAFPNFANITTAARVIKAWTGGFNWYLSHNVKVTSNYEYTRFEGGSTGVTGPNRRPERAILSRVQVVY